MSKLVSQATDLELLQELISRNGHAQAPTKVLRFDKQARETLVAAGKDETVTITFYPDALKEMGLE